MKRNKKRLVGRFLPCWAIIPLLSILCVNHFVYWGSSLMTQERFHYDLTTGLDRMVPLVPEFVWIYLGAYAFWACGYIMASWRGKEMFYRFVATDLAVHAACFAIFLIFPTTNVRPGLPGNTISEKVLELVYHFDGGENPYNLLPSIHCYVSWMCYRGIKGSGKVPAWYQSFSLAAAILIIVSTQVLKQHYIIDAIAGVALVEIFWFIFREENRYRKVMSFFEYINKKFWKNRKMGECL